MVAVGMLLVWGGYAVSLWGWALLRDYDVTFGQLTSPVHPYMSNKGDTWPPAKVPDTQIWPSGTKAAKAAAGTPVSQKGAPCPKGQIRDDRPPYHCLQELT
jgi:hypothetical protein